MISMIQVLTVIAIALAVAMSFVAAHWLAMRHECLHLRRSCERKNRRIAWLIDRVRSLEEGPRRPPLYPIPGGRIETK